MISSTQVIFAEKCPGRNVVVDKVGLGLAKVAERHGFPCFILFNQFHKTADDFHSISMNLL